MATTDTIDQPGQRRPSRSKKPVSPLRTDIQGLRALAVGLIVLYHLWPGTFHGGFVAVDIFFVISGFLITSHLLTKPPSSGRDLAGFWMRRIRRLFPAALVVIAATLVLVRLLAPETVWRTHAMEGIASALYYQNWELADQSVDYMASERSASAMQHYWSLSVEEQFYIVWPLLMVASVLIARRLRARLEVAVLVGVSVLFLASLAFSIYYTQVQPEKAYFVSPTRAWQFATGAMLATIVMLIGKRAAHTRGKRAIGELLVWSGYAAVIFAVATYDGSDYPGWRALVPCLGCAAIIAGYSERGPNPNQLFRSRPAQYLGDISYSTYLWHWPVIVLAPYALGHEPGFGELVGLGALGIALGSATKHLVEDRFRRPSPARSVFVPYRWAAVGMAGVVALGMLQVAEIDRRTQRDIKQLQLAAASTDPCFAASALRSDNNCPIGEVPKPVPSPALAPRDRSFSYAHDCQTKVPFNTVKRCVFGDSKAKRNVALVGNSHAIHWLPALHQVALREHFKITTFFTEQCFATETRIKFSTPTQTENCYRWGRQVLKETGSGNFDLVITSNRTYKQPVEKGPRNEVFEKGYERYLKGWLKAERKVLVIRDTPLPDATLESVPECLAEHKDPRKCTGEKEKWIRTDPLAEAAKNLEDKGAIVANLTDWFCPADRCPTVIGRTLVYFDASHMTATFSRSLAPFLRPIVHNALEEKSEDGKEKSHPKPDPEKDPMVTAADPIGEAPARPAE